MVICSNHERINELETNLCIVEKRPRNRDIAHEDSTRNINRKKERKGRQGTSLYITSR
jgi:hypothetical protein